MKLLCKLVGHQPPVYAGEGWYSPGEEYAKVLVGAMDGLGTIHARIEAECARCKEKFIVCRIHIPECYSLKPRLSLTKLP